MNPLTPLELLVIIEREHGFESPSIRLALAELEELKRDVKKFIELLMKDNPTGRDTFDIEILKDKLMKVGREE